MKRVILLLMILAMALSASACSILNDLMATTEEVDAGNFSIVIPSTYLEVEDQDNAYYIDNKDMYLEYYYYPREFDMDGSTMLNILVANQFFADDIVDEQKTEIDGVDVYQVQYRTLTTGVDDIHYYYSGLYSVFELDNEFFILDVYQYMTESVGINTFITDDDLKLLHDMTNTVKIKGYSGEASSTKEDKYIDALTIQLSNNWSEVGEDNGYQDWGYFVEHGFYDLAFYVDVFEYSDENVTDMETLLDMYAEYPQYEYYGDVTVAGEAGYAFKYEYESDDGSFVYGMCAETEHYFIDIYFYTVMDSYEMPKDVADAFFDCINAIQ